MIKKFDSSKFISELTSKAGLCLSDFAIAMGHPGRNDIVVKVRNNIRKLSASELFMLCQVFDVDIFGKPLHNENYSFDLNRVIKILNEIEKNNKNKW